MSQKLNDLPNIGANLASRLEKAGITTADELINLGAESAFSRLHAFDGDSCINSFYAIEGAIQGIRWHGIPKERKQELLKYFKDITES